MREEIAKTWDLVQALYLLGIEEGTIVVRDVRTFVNYSGK